MDHEDRWHRLLRYEVAVVAVAAYDSGDSSRSGVDGGDRQVGASGAADQKDPTWIAAVIVGVRPHPFDRGEQSATCSSVSTAGAGDSWRSRRPCPD